MTATCPNDDVLSRLLEGGLTGPERDTLTAHLDGCEGCQRAAETILSSRLPVRPVSRPEETLSQVGREFLDRLAASVPLPRTASLSQPECGGPPPPQPEALP